MFISLDHNDVDDVAVSFSLKGLYTVLGFVLYLRKKKNEIEQLLLMMIVPKHIQCYYIQSRPHGSLQLPIYKIVFGDHKSNAQRTWNDTENP